MCWPLFLAEATAGQERPALIVGGITAAGYVGFVAGPPVVGWISSAWGLRVGLVTLAATALLTGLLPRKRVPVG
jgi:MFS family permease